MIQKVKYTNKWVYYANLQVTNKNIMELGSLFSLFG